jgi:hypothetical protein
VAKKTEVGISNILIQGIIHVTGDPDSGKTTFALECGAPPNAIAFFDDDVKGRATVRQFQQAGVEFGAYHDLTAIASGKTEMQFHDACMEIVTGMRPGQYETIVWDTWTNFQKTLHPYVLANRTRFRSTWSPMGQIKGAQEWQEAQKYEASILNDLQTIAPTVIVVTHLKDYYEGNARVPGKQIPASSKTLVRVPRFRIWLRPNPSSPVPIGLVLKRIDTKVATPRGIRTTSVLPRKIVPGVEDQSLWDTIARYFENPVGMREFTPDEIPDAYELSILDGTLTSDQKRTFELMLKAGVLEVGPDELDVATIDQAQIDTIKESLRADGKPITPAAIADILGVTVPEVLKYM